MEDASDILGGQLHVAQHGASMPWLNTTATGLLYYTLMTILLGLALYFSHPFYLTLRDRRYRKSLRRRHGIPDNDRRPFNLAFAAAKRAHSKHDSEEVISLTGSNVAQAGSQSTALQRHVPRQRQNMSGITRAQYVGADGTVVLSRGSSHVDSRRTSGNTATASETDYNPAQAAQQHTTAGVPGAQPSQRGYQPKHHTEAPVTRMKHGLDDDEDDEDEKESKKTRVEGDDMIDGDEQAEWHESDAEMDVDEASPAALVRGSKRAADADEDEGFESSRGAGRDKRARKVSKGKEGERAAHAALAGGVRGKKRDRTEAAAGLGGAEVVVDNEDEDGQQRASRRRRVVPAAKKVSKARRTSNSRGRKRGRDAASPSSGGDSDSPSMRAAKLKRGKHVLRAGETTDEDADMSIESQCAGRHVGEEWEVGNVRYRIGLDGQRQRQAFVKGSRPWFKMPKDSEHPDRGVEVDVCVDTWLTDEQYRVAKERQELAGPEAVREIVASTPLEAPDSPSKGKRLLWSSVSSKDVLAPRSRTTSLASNAARVNPSNGAVIRRISTLSTIGPVVQDNANIRVTKSFSKWEKQEREAQSLAYLSELGKKEATVEPAKKLLGAAPTAAPAFSLVNAGTAGATQSKPSEQPAPTTAAPPAAPVPSTASNPFSFSKPAAATTPAIAPPKASTSDLPSLTIPSAPAKAPEPVRPPMVPFPSSNAPQTVGQPKPAAPVNTPAPPASNSFSFGKQTDNKPAAATPSGTQAPSASVPNFFANPSATPSVPTPPSNMFTAPSGSAPAQSAAPTNSPFSFGPSAPAASAVVKTERQNPVMPAPAAAPSLLSRMGGFSAPSQPAATPAATNPTQVSSFWTNPASSSNPAPVGASAPTSSSGSAPMNFSFGSTATSAAPAPTAPTSANGPAPVTFTFGPSATPAVPAPAAPAPTNAPAPLKFNFGTTSTSTATPAMEGNKPPQPFSFPQTTTSSATTTAPSTNAAKQSSAAKFSFVGLGNSNSKPIIFGAPPTAPQATSGVNASATPMFSMPPPNSQNGNGAAGSAFGSAPSAFGAPSMTTQNSGTGMGSTFGNTSTAQTGAAKTPFTFGSGNGFNVPSTPVANNNPFGASTTPAGTPGAPAMFGTPLPAPNFGGTFGSTTPAGRPPASSIFGQGSTTPAGTPAQAKDAAKLTFSFGSTTPAGPPPSSQPKFSFGVGNAPTAANNASGFGSGGQATPSAFGFGAPVASSAPTTFSFGKPANQDSMQK